MEAMKIYIKKWQCFEHLNLEFGPFNVLVGDNDSGKTALLDWLRGVDPSICVVDGAEEGWHWSYLRSVVENFREGAEEEQRRVVLSTHSPYLVDACTPEEVIVLWRNSYGVTQARRMSESAEVARMREHFQTGEILTELGEYEIVTGVTVAEANKRKEAKDTTEMCTWQLPPEEKKRRFYGL